MLFLHYKNMQLCKKLVVTCFSVTDSDITQFDPAVKSLFSFYLVKNQENE